MTPLNKNGFTLLEVMIAVAIMAGLTLLTAQTMRSSVLNQRFVNEEITRDATLADTLRIMRSDIAQAFHYQDIFCKMKQEASQPEKKAGDTGTGGDMGGAGGATTGAMNDPNKTQCPEKRTGFIGTADKLYFTTLSNLRVIKDSQESDQAKVGYYLKSCRAAGARRQGFSNCLYRSTSPFLDNDLETPGDETMLLENVEELKFRYLGTGQEPGELAEQWRTWKDGADATAKENFPYAVEISLTVHNKNDPRDKPATQTVLAPIYFENNPKKPKQAQQNN